MALWGHGVDTNDRWHHMFQKPQMVVHKASSISGGQRRTGESALWHSRSSESGKEVGDGIQNQVRLAGQQRLTPTAAGEDGDRLEAQRFARRNIDRAISD